MFNKKLFGYDKEQVDEKFKELSSKILAQQKDIDYLRNEKLKLKNKLESEKSDLQVEK